MRAALACLLLAGLPALGRAESRPHYGSSVEAPLLGAPAGFDPVTAQASADITVVGLIFDTLYTIGPDGVARPHLALGPPALDAARTAAHIALRRGVQFHDATPVTAADVVASLERVRGKAAWVLAPVTAIRASGDGIDVELRADTDVAALLALPQTAITKHGHPPGPRPIGSGPFALDSFDPAAKQLTLRAFDAHFAGRAYLDQLVLRWFDSPDGEARRFETGLAQLSARGVAVFAGGTPKHPAAPVESPAALLVFVGFGKRHAPITGERGFRQALDLALDRGALSTITTGERTVPTRRPLPGEPLDAAGLVGDPVRARARLDAVAARVPSLAAGIRASLKLVIIIDETRPDDREIALRVSRGLDKLGIGFTIEALPADRLRDRVLRGDCDLWIGQLAEPMPVAAAWWGAAFAAGNDDWARGQLATGALDPAAAAREFASRQPIVPLMFRSLLVWHRVDVHGLAFDASARPGFADLYWPRGKP
jgi:peptide/nickel transport system substrate-binding protein